MFSATESSGKLFFIPRHMYSPVRENALGNNRVKTHFFVIVAARVAKVQHLLGLAAVKCVFPLRVDVHFNRFPMF